MLEKKRQLFNELIEQNGPPPSLGLTEDEIFGLFDIRPRVPTGRRHDLKQMGLMGPIRPMITAIGQRAPHSP